MKIYTNELWKPIQAAVGVKDDGKAGDATRAAIAKKIGCNDDWYSIQAAVGTSIDGNPGAMTINAICAALGLTVKKGNRHIVIDIGHANGTGSTGNGLEEHAVNVVIVDHLKKLLREAGHTVTVIDYPEKDNRDDLNQTIKFLNNMTYDCAVSLHSDWSEKESACGGHVCFKSGDTTSRVLAYSIAQFLSGLLPGRAETVQARTNLGILNQTKRKPVVLCEGGFISNRHDSSIMRDHPEWIAEAYFSGIQNYFQL